MPEVNTTEMATESVSWSQQREAEAHLQVPDQRGPGDVADKPIPHPGQVLGLECEETSEDPTVDFVKTSNGGGVS